ncbi:MAG TPA: glycosyltransferase [Longimicrobium sp.]|nr:glycosyltransferase [Longimicrobium sp.]
MNVSVCVCTDRRPRSLQRLLDALVWIRADRVAGALEVVVLDADPAGSAREACAETAPRLPWPLRYVHAPRAGASPRAGAAAAVRADADWIAFLDDDEEPTPRWLDELLRVQADYAADVVAGPVVPRFEARVPAWVIGGRLFELPRHRTGTRLPCADAGNVLVRADVLRQSADPEAVLGGASGVVWADEALAYEWVPPSRVSLRWLLRRAFRWGNAWAVCERHLDSSRRVNTVRLARAAGRIARGTLLLAASAVRGRDAAVQALRGICFAAGSLAGLAGFRIGEPFLG